jgi:hypothetical protein|tara:strand:+ start:730 stop:1026 length:297 start_codon:yes stop_codon:yes gene_type:complete
MEKLETLELAEIKLLCKKHGVSIIGDKKTLIKKLNYFLVPVSDTINTHPGRKLSDDKKIIAVKTTEKEKLNLILKNKVSFLYYSFGYHYYLVNKQLEV